jgi:DNA-binding response OmpR family regulator
MPQNRGRVLVVEDDPVLRESVGAALAQADFVVRTSSDGRDLDEQLAGFRPDIALLDVMLPGQSGLALARRIRTRSSAAVVFVTARDTVADRLDGFEVGADDYIVKPFALAELIARLRAVLRRTGQTHPATVEVDDVIIDESSGVVVRAGQPVPLTATELRLLTYLARNHGRVLSKTQILTQVWGYESYDPNLVETFVSGLRRKLEAGERPRVIHTVRGIGYRMGVR